MKKINVLLALFVLMTACNGQSHAPLDNKQVRKGSLGSRSVSTIEAAGKPKLVRTQGTDEFANVYCGLQDKAGNLWFGTTGEGVYRYDGKLFTQFTVHEGLTSNTVYSILEDTNGNIWFGTASGACRYDGKTISVVPFAITSRNAIYSSFNANGTIKTEVWSMLQDRKGTLWFGTRDGVYCYDGTSFTRFLDDYRIVNAGDLHLRMVDCMLEDHDGNVWFCSGMPPGEEGLCRYDGRSITSIKPYGSGWIRKIIEERNGNLLIATRQDGVCRYDVNCEAKMLPRDNRIVGECVTQFTEAALIDNGSVSTILEDHKGNVWIATELGSGELGEDGGVWRYDPSAESIQTKEGPRTGSKSFTRFTTKEGLVHNGVFCIVEDKSGNLWFGTRDIGLSRYDGKNFTNFSGESAK